MAEKSLEELLGAEPDIGLGLVKTPFSDEYFKRQMSDTFGSDEYFKRQMSDTFGSDEYFKRQMSDTFGSDEYFKRQMSDTFGSDNIRTNTVTPSLMDEYFKRQMYKPVETDNKEIDNKDLFMGMNPNEWSSAMKAGQLGLGGMNLGLGVLSYFQNKGLADKQKEVLGQQIESNRAEIDSRKKYRAALEKF